MASSVPSLDARCACISPYNQPTIAALISSYLARSRTYFPVFGFPSVDEPYARENDFQSDGYIGRLLGTSAAVQINNVLFQLRPQKIILAGMTSAQKSYFYAYLNKLLIIEVDSVEHLQKQLPAIAAATGPRLKCRPAEVIQGLMKSKYWGQPITLSDEAPAVPSEHIKGKEHVVVIENEGLVDQVVAVNYAFSIDADVALVKPFEKSEARDFQRLIHEWKTEGSQEALTLLEEKIWSRMSHIDVSRYRSATFFTRGVPYGLLIKNAIPCAHVLLNVRTDLFVTNNIGYENFPASFDSALVFSPEEFDDEETGEVVNMLENHRYAVKALMGPRATVKALSNHAQYYPYDIMHICSHGGETNGYYVVQEFTDRNGANHRVEYEEIVGFSPTSADKVLVIRKLIFRRFDGLPWMSKELSQLPQEIFEDMRKAFALEKESSTTTRVWTNHPIYTSCHIKCYDSIHQGELGSIASGGCPIIFNNTCSSWYEIATNFLSAGCRAYIGTLWKVGNTTARYAAKEFYAEVLSHGRLLDAFHAMNKAIKSIKYQNIYLFWGLHMATVKPPAEKSDQRVFNALLGSLILWLRQYHTTQDAAARRNFVPVLNFLLNEINDNFTPEHRARLESEISTQLPEESRSFPTEEEPPDDVSRRGVLDIQAGPLEEEP